jgi:hypothetical protein
MKQTSECSYEYRDAKRSDIAYALPVVKDKQRHCVVT